MGAGLIEIDEDFSKIGFASPFCASMRFLDLRGVRCMVGIDTFARLMMQIPLIKKQRTVRRGLSLDGSSMRLI